MLLLITYFNLYKYELFIIIATIFLYNKSIGIICYILYIILLIAYIYDYQNINIVNKSKCRKNNLNNPFGNYLLNNNPNIQSCNNNNSAKSYNTFNLYENAINKQITSNNKSLRQFYTTPITTKINNTIEFANALKPNILSCKINGYCLQHKLY